MSLKSLNLEINNNKLIKNVKNKKDNFFILTPAIKDFD
jgi:hypothetical protein